MGSERETETRLRSSVRTLLGRVRSGGSLARDRGCGSHDRSDPVDVAVDIWVGRHCERHWERMSVFKNKLAKVTPPSLVPSQGSLALRSWEP